MSHTCALCVYSIETVHVAAATALDANKRHAGETKDSNAFMIMIEKIDKRNGMRRRREIKMKSSVEVLPQINSIR